MSAAAGIARPTGAGMLEAIRDGVLDPPPAARLLDLELTLVEPGHTCFDFRPDQRFDNGEGAVHGGILAAVADFGVTTAVKAAVALETAVVTTNLSLTYVRPVRPDVPVVHCDARVVHVGRRLAHAEAELRDEHGRLHLRATATCHLATA